MSTKDVILTITLMLAAGLGAELIAELTRVPPMLLLLAAGALLGPSVAGAIDIPLDSMGAELILTLGVSFILFHGGLQLSLTILSRVAVGLLLLVIPGVLVTALLTGSVAAVVFGVPLTTGLLIGAALSPTDPAILIPLFERMRLRAKVAQTVIAESAMNDPTGAVLALAFAGVVLSGNASLTAPMTDFLVDLALSTVLGIVFGIVLSAVVSSRRTGIWRESAAIVVIAVVSGSFFSIDSAGGSGYLGAFLAGLILGNMPLLGLGMHSHHEDEMRAFVSTVSHTMVMLVFITLGANLPWRGLADHFAPSLAVLATLIFVARPLVVFGCLLLDRRGSWTWEEVAFLAWTRETGVVPAALAGIIVAMHVPNADLVVTSVALAIIVTLGLQSTTKHWLARRLRLLDGDVQPPPSPPFPAPASVSPTIGS